MVLGLDLNQVWKDKRGASGVEKKLLTEIGKKISKVPIILIFTKL